MKRLLIFSALRLLRLDPLHLFISNYDARFVTDYNYECVFSSAEGFPEIMNRAILTLF